MQKSHPPPLPGGPVSGHQAEPFSRDGKWIQEYRAAEAGICHLTCHLLLLSRTATNCICNQHARYIPSVIWKLEGFHGNSQHQPPT